MSNVDFQPVLLASDINVYSMARAFHEAYGVKSLGLARSISGPCENSKIIDFRIIEDLDETEVFVDYLTKLYEEFKGKKKLVLVGCADHYVRLIVENKDRLKDMYVLPYADKESMDNIVLKETFYGLCSKYGLDYAKTFVFKYGMDLDFELPFDFPVVLKPSCSVSFNKHHFPGQKKVYFPDNMEELRAALKEIYDHGYDNSMIIQDRVPGADDAMFDLHVYVGSDHKVKMMNMGNVLLEEHTPKGIGSNAATIVDPHPEIMEKVKFLLEDIGYQGMADCDLKYDERDGKIKIFEINIRQGRSHYRITGGGNNIARYMIEDFLYHNEIEEQIVTEPFFWHVVPLGVVYKYVKDQKKLARVKELVKQGKYCHSLYYKKDMGFKRWVYLKLRDLNQFKKFKQYLGNK